MHYTEGWADGYNYKIRYWEIWNEPEVQDKMMWNGTPEEFYELYTVAATHLKNRFPHLKIGGYASCGFYVIEGSFIPDAASTPRFEYFLDFFEEFMEYMYDHAEEVK